jgi:SAM-dependent methyltransferase
VADPSWSEGYVVDLDYTRGYFRELSPGHLRFVLLLAGMEPPGAAQPFTYYELGCGNGHSTALHAAANPHGRFCGVDFNPAHIHHAQKLAQDAGIGNVRFLEKSFAELLQMELEDADYVALHGVWSWVNDENRAQVLEFLRRRLKPGGIVYLSYNALPGLAQVAPLQHLLNAHAGLAAGDRIEKVRRSMDFTARLQKAGARFFTVSPAAVARLASMARLDPHYLAHEYYNANWSPFYHADVARALADAKLSYAAAASVLDNFDQFTLNAETAKLVAEVGERALAETIKDYARNQSFRRDVYARGVAKAAPPVLEAALDRARFALARPRASARMQMATAAGEVTLQPEAYAPALDALARSPMTFAELARAPECASLNRGKLRQAVFGMAALGNVQAALPAAEEDARREGTIRFNAAALRAPIADAGDLYLASPVTGAGVAVNLVDRLFLAAADEDAGIERARAAAASGRLKVRHKEKDLESADEQDAYIRDRARFFFGDYLPYLRLLRVVD